MRSRLKRDQQQKQSRKSPAVFFFLLKAVEIAQQLRMLATLSEDQNLVPSIHMAHSLLQFQAQVT